MKKLLFIIGLLMFFVTGCDKESTNPDVEESKLSIIIPTNNSTVTGIVTIVIDYDGDETISRVEYYVNSNLIGQSSSSPFSINWNTSELSNGSFDLVAIGYTENDVTIVSNTVSGTIYNEIPSEANIVFDTSDFFPSYRGYKYNLGHQYGVCGETDYPYCYLIYSAKVKNIGGKTANNVKVLLTVIVGNNINGNPTSGNSYFTSNKNFGSLQPGESKSETFDSRYSCNYGTGNYVCFDEITIDDIITQITWD